MSVSYINPKDKIINKKSQKSLTLLKVNALKAALRVPIFVTQKFIKRNDVSPISSHPKNSITKLPEDTKKIILIINNSKNKINLSTSGSYLK